MFSDQGIQPQRSQSMQTRAHASSRHGACGRHGIPRSGTAKKAKRTTADGHCASACSHAVVQMVSAVLVGSPFLCGGELCINVTGHLLEDELRLPSNVWLEDLSLRAEALHQGCQVNTFLWACGQLGRPARHGHVQLSHAAHVLGTESVACRGRSSNLPSDVLLSLFLQVRDRRHHLIIPLEVVPSPCTPSSIWRRQVCAHPGTSSTAITSAVVKTPASGDCTTWPWTSTSSGTLAIATSRIATSEAILVIHVHAVGRTEVWRTVLGPLSKTA
mmetsp:Transcript_37593/g.67437  ORF Transcript_37593/g.67437 Transcript_37593/m.67437 type:complete len:273 (+) Transcript_37593:1-819(+)